MSIVQTIEQRLNALEQAVAELRQQLTPFPLLPTGLIGLLAR